VVDDSDDLIRIDEERCTCCALCVQVCETGAIALGDKGAELSHPEDCGGCALCEDVCPEGAITCQFEIVWGEDTATASGTEGGAHA
jgi:MinD superfamily P-loop ATPase